MIARFSFLLFLNLVTTISFAQEFQQHVFNIYFKTNQDAVTSESQTAIRQQLLAIGSANIREIKIMGHADSDATDSFNINLSNRRASNTYHYLILQGVPETILAKEAFGESDPVSELKQLNRRVEITVIYDYANAMADLKGKKFYIKGIVKNFNTNLTLPCGYVIEDQKLNIFQSTRPDGRFYLPAKPGKNVSLTFSKLGFLNETVIITDKYFMGIKGDTIFIEVKLKPIEVVEKIVFDHIFFYSDSDSLKPESRPELQKLTALLRNDKELYVEIQGHMNCPLSRPMNVYQKRYNHELSHKRARAIYKYLINNGIPASQLTFKGMSNTNMIYPEPKNEQEADKNKRVEVWKLKVVTK